MRQIFDEVCRAVDAGGNDVAFATIESSVNITGDGDTTLIFASDGQLELYYVRVIWCTSTPLFGWCLRYFISCLRSSSSTPITRFRCCMLS